MHQGKSGADSSRRGHQKHQAPGMHRSNLYFFLTMLLASLHQIVPRHSQSSIHYCVSSLALLRCSTNMHASSITANPAARAFSAAFSFSFPIASIPPSPDSNRALHHRRNFLRTPKKYSADLIFSGTSSSARNSSPQHSSHSDFHRNDPVSLTLHINPSRQKLDRIGFETTRPPNRL